MEKPLHEYKIDRYSSVQKGNVAMGCGVQYITAEAANEPLPIYDAAEGIYFTADCIVDNRDELISELCPGRTDIPDGELMFLAYKKWGESMPKRIYGAYSYAVYEEKECRLILGVDHVLNRCLYYFRDGEKLYFSTAFNPIFAGSGKNPTLNEEWLTVFLAINILSTMTNPVDTPYLGVSRVVASHYMSFEKAGAKSVKYWSYRDIKPLRLGGDDEYKARFRALMEKVTRETLRTDGEVGILLSSGFDSATVAAFAAPELTKRGRELLAYTYVPIEGYQNHYNARARETNEQAGVERFCAMYPNIVMHFQSAPEINAISSVKGLMSKYAVPYKSLTNVAWVDALKGMASAAGCKIMLDGQFGNISISPGSVDTYVKTKLVRGRPFHAFSTLNRYAKRRGISRRWLFPYVLKSVIPVSVRRLFIRDYFDSSVVNRETAKAIGFKKRDKRIQDNAIVPRALSDRETFHMSYDEVGYAHTGDLDAQSGLMYGMAIRDITKDIRVLEFCLSLPVECKVNSRLETRRLVRHYLSDKFPAENISEEAPRGRQSGDWLARMLPKWDEIYGELKRVLNSRELEKYVDAEVISKLLAKYKNPPENRDEMEFLTVGYAYAAGMFLESREWSFE